MMNEKDFRAGYMTAYHHILEECKRHLGDDECGRLREIEARLTRIEERITEDKTDGSK